MQVKSKTNGIKVMILIDCGSGGVMCGKVELCLATKTAMIRKIDVLESKANQMILCVRRKNLFDGCSTTLLLGICMISCEVFLVRYSTNGGF